MGGGGGEKSSSHSSTSESALSQEQLKILRTREQQYNDWFFPELKKATAETDLNSSVGAARFSQMTGDINKSFASSEKQLTQGLSQQGMLGGPSGVQAALRAKNQRARASALATAYYDTLQDQQGKKANLLQLGASMMPTPTTSAQYHQNSSSDTTAFQGKVI